MSPAPRRQASPAADTLTPAQRYAELFVAVQRERVFPDSKTFPDVAPRGDPAAILQAYRREHRRVGFDLPAFVQAHFILQPPAARGFASQAGQPLSAHIDALWSILERHPAEHVPGSSLLPLPHDYVVPGGRFVEMYYWDSYFTMLGLAASGREGLARAMTDNFADLIDRYGHVPNGTRTYYLSRSQPPMFVLMVELLEQIEGTAGTRYLPQLLREHAFWMQGETSLAGPGAHRRVVRLPDGSVLNRYWDDLATPREESWREDVATAGSSGKRAAEDIYRNLRAACESGWDFSSRWLEESATTPPTYGELRTIRTTHLLPVDLNALLYRLEETIARLAHTTGDERTQRAFAARAERRANAVNRVLWDEQRGAWFDYDWTLRRLRQGLTAATAGPLFVRMGDEQRAARVGALLRARLLTPAGLATTEQETGQQWDRPNGWAPLQWIAAEGLAYYNQRELANDIRERWLRTVAALYCREGKLVEKYAQPEASAHTARGGSGGEYPLQDGFGWTNGVVRSWLRERPEFDRCVAP